jgi:hypothetical protein
MVGWTWTHMKLLIKARAGDFMAIAAFTTHDPGSSFGSRPVELQKQTSGLIGMVQKVLSSNIPF